MRELIKSMAELEAQLLSRYGVTPNEAMTLCCLGSDTLTASCISKNVGLSPSNTSKVLSSIEKKGLAIRSMGDIDRRQMRFTLTSKGQELLHDMKNEEIDIPEFIRPLFLQ
ncbi:MAG: winged helix DNA-binding protein [Bacteroides sp.]|nr:winged helix DNA-binding protein [Bacteroides sp.]MCM1457410.1 winged helix DNA-binding protein [Lachnoclostridium sp.]